MYVRALTFICREETVRDEVVQVYRMLAAKAEENEGFVGSTLLMREGACQGMALIFWSDEDAAQNAGPHLIKLLGEHAYGLMETPPEIAGYHVIENGIIHDPNAV
jgi:heme-degrading monooxygenase HmoA